MQCRHGVDVGGVGDVSVNAQRSIGKSSFDTFSFDFGYGTMQMVFYVVGPSKMEALQNASKLIGKCKTCKVKTLEDINSEYVCVMESYSVEWTEVMWVYMVTIDFNCIRRLPKKTVTFSGVSEVKFMNEGTIDSGVSIVVKSASVETDVSVYGIVIDSLKAEMPFEIDGIAGEVIENGINSILRTDLTEFPKVQPGENTMTSSAPLDWEVSWYPTFVV